MTPTRHDLDDDLQDLSARLHDLADRWEVRPSEGRPDLAPARSWVPGWLRGGMVPVLAGLVLVALVVAASAWLSTLGTTPAPVPADQAPPDATGTVVDLLDQVPAEVAGDGDIRVTLGDVARATDLAGVRRPSPDADDEVGRWKLQALSGGDPTDPDVDSGYVWVPDPLWFDLAAYRQELGWSLLDVDQFVDLSGPSPVLGRGVGASSLGIDEGLAVVTGAAGTGEFPPALDDLGNGVVQAGTDDVTLQDSTPARLQGAPLFLSRQDGRLAMASDRDMLDAWQSGSGPTLANDPAVAAVAARIADDQPTAVVIERGSFTVDPSRATGGDPSVLPAPFDAAGVAWSRDQAGPRLTIVLHHDTPDAARRNAVVLRDSWGDGLWNADVPAAGRVSIVDVLTEGALDIVTLRSMDGNAAGGVFELLAGRTFPFVHVDPAGAGARSDGAPESPNPTAMSTLDDANVRLEADFRAELDALPVAGDPVLQWRNAPEPEVYPPGDTVEAKLVDAGQSPGEPGILRVHAVCSGTGSLAVTAASEASTTTIASSDPIPCDGEIHRSEFEAPAWPCD